MGYSEEIVLGEDFDEANLNRNEINRRSVQIIDSAHVDLTLDSTNDPEIPYLSITDSFLMIEISQVKRW